MMYEMLVLCISGIVIVNNVKCMYVCMYVCFFKGGAYFRLATASMRELVEEVPVRPWEVGNESSGSETRSPGW